METSLRSKFRNAFIMRTISAAKVDEKRHSAILVLSFFSFSVLCGTFSGCASNEAFSLKSNHDAVAVSSQGERKTLAAGKEELLSSKTPWKINSQSNGTSVLLIPLHVDSNDKVEVSFEKSPLSNQELGSKEHLAEEKNDLLSQFVRIQKLLAKKTYEDALAESQKLIQKHPDVVYLRFLSASCLFSLNRLNEARVQLNMALKSFPEDADGQALLTLLNSRLSTQGAVP